MAGYLRKRVQLHVQVPNDQPIREPVAAALLSRPFYWQAYKKLSSNSDMSVIECHITMYDVESHRDYILFIHIRTNLSHVLFKQQETAWATVFHTAVVFTVIQKQYNPTMLLDANC